jgi:F-type H+-transporting ATPase subunit delta
VCSSDLTKAATEAGLGKVEIETKVDEDLIGGFVLEFNNNLVDASIARDLRDIKTQFSKNIYVNSIR